MKTVEIGPKFYNSLPRQDQAELNAYMRCRGFDPNDVVTVIFHQRWRLIREMEVYTFFRDDLTGKLVWDDIANDIRYNNARFVRVIAFPRIIRRMMEVA